MIEEKENYVFFNIKQNSLILAIIRFCQKLARNKYNEMYNSGTSFCK